MSRWRLGGWLLAAAAYALLSHWLMLHAADEPWAVALLLGPLLLMGAGVALQRRHGVALLGLAACGAVLAWVAARGGVGSANRLYLLQHVGIHVGMGVGFALTLRRGQISLIGRLAQRMHGTLSDAKRRYTRHVTLLWVAYFFAMAAASFWVYAVCDWAAWSLLANVVTPVAIATIFVGEYLLRYRLHPEFERDSLADALRAWRE